MKDYASVVRDNHRRTIGYLVASVPPCIEIRDDEIHRIQRRLVALSLDDLDHLEPGASWLMGVILCPDDDTKMIAAFAKCTGAHHRVRFYLHPKTVVAEVFSAWKQAGFRLARAHEVTTWKHLHPVFGKALNDQVYEDFT